MKNRIVFSSLAVVMVLAIVAIFVANTVTTVSAKQILDRAYQAQTQQAAVNGIQHTRSEIYTNLEALPEDQGIDTIVESYFDPQSGKLRVVTTDKGSGKVLNVSAFDGSYSYTQLSDKEDRSDNTPLTIYRGPQTSIGSQDRYPRVEEFGSRDMFDRMRSNPNVEFLGKETWADGHTVYALRSEQQIKLLVSNAMLNPIGFVTMYFDADTYEILGNRVTMEKDGKELLISSQRILVDETLPAESHITWDLSDLQGISIVDDPNNEHSVPKVIPPEVIPAEVLASKTESAYLLETVPDGFSLEVSILPKQPADEPFFYEAGYTSRNGDYFSIRTFGDKIKDTSWADEHYTAANGLVLHFNVEAGVPSTGGEFTSALVEAPNGMTYVINSTLPRETIKALAEELVLVK